MRVILDFKHNNSYYCKYFKLSNLLCFLLEKKEVIGCSLNDLFLELALMFIVIHASNVHWQGKFNHWTAVQKTAWHDTIFLNKRARAAQENIQIPACAIIIMLSLSLRKCCKFATNAQGYTR